MENYCDFETLTRVVNTKTSIIHIGSNVYSCKTLSENESKPIIIF